MHKSAGTIAIMNNKTPLSTQPLIEVKNLSFNRGERVIYDNISLNIRRGQITAIMGPSGTCLLYTSELPTICSV